MGFPAASNVSSAAAATPPTPVVRLPRVVSLLPSATEILCLVGGAAQMVGRSHECDFPDAVTGVPMLTAAKNEFESSRQMHEAVAEELQTGAGLYTVDQKQLQALAPQVVLTQSLCSVCCVDLATVTAVTRGMFPPPAIVSLNPLGLDDVIADCVTVGAAVGRPAEGLAAAAALAARLARMRQVVAEAGGAVALGKVAFMEWLDPIFIGGHWTPELIQIAGGTHPLNTPGSHGGGAPPSFVVTPEQLTACDPDWIILCPCGLDIPTTQNEATALLSQPWWSNLRAVRERRVAVVDGNQMFNRPGPRLLDALEWLVGLLQSKPDVIPHSFPWQMWQPTAEEVGHALDSADAGGGGASGAGTCPQGSAAAAGACEPRMSCAPGMADDIEDAHAAACCAGSSTYIDPRSGYTAWTEDGLTARGHCCGNRCRHCPWGHYRVQRPGVVRINRPSRAVLLQPGAGPFAKKDGMHAAPLIVRGGAAPQGGRVLLVWAGDDASRAALATLQGEGAQVVLLLACEGRVLAWGPRLGDDIGAAMDLSISAGVPLLVVPLSPAGSVLHHNEAPDLPAAASVAGQAGQAGQQAPPPATLSTGGVPLGAEAATGSGRSAELPSQRDVCRDVLRAGLQRLGEGGATVLACAGGTDALPSSSGARAEALGGSDLAVAGAGARGDAEAMAVQQRLDEATWAHVLADVQQLRARPCEELVLRVM